MFQSFITNERKWYLSYICHLFLIDAMLWLDKLMEAYVQPVKLLRKTAFKLEGKASEDIWLWYSGRSLMVEFHVGQNYSWSPTMLNGAPVYWVEEYQCSCRFISWHYGYTNLRVFTAVQPVSSSLSLDLAKTQREREREIASMHVPEAGWFINSLKLVFNNKVLADSELIPKSIDQGKVSACAKISEI